jgi:uncharacterized membrane protein YvbJ
MFLRAQPSPIVHLGENRFGTWITTHAEEISKRCMPSLLASTSVIVIILIIFQILFSIFKNMKKFAAKYEEIIEVMFKDL